MTDSPDSRLTSAFLRLTPIPGCCDVCDARIAAAAPLCGKNATSELVDAPALATLNSAAAPSEGAPAGEGRTNYVQAIQGTYVPFAEGEPFQLYPSNRPESLTLDVAKDGSFTIAPDATAEELRAALTMVTRAFNQVRASSAALAARAPSGAPGTDWLDTAYSVHAAERAIGELGAGSVSDGTTLTQDQCSALLLHWRKLLREARESVTPSTAGRDTLREADDGGLGQMSARDEADAERVADLMRARYGVVYVARHPRSSVERSGEGWCVMYGAATTPQGGTD